MKINSAYAKKSLAKNEAAEAYNKLSTELKGKQLTED